MPSPLLYDFRVTIRTIFKLSHHPPSYDSFYLRPSSSNLITITLQSMTMNCFPILLIFLIFSASSASDCVFTETQCQCSRRQTGDFCLRYSSGTTNKTCISYICGAGYVCDCKFIGFCFALPKFVLPQGLI